LREKDLRSQVQIRLIARDLKRFFSLIAFRSGEKSIAVLERVRHEARDSTEIGVAYFEAEYELMKSNISTPLMYKRGKVAK
jgi:chaperonin GroEL (HSP60 family)